MSVKKQWCLVSLPCLLIPHFYFRSSCYVLLIGQLNEPPMMIKWVTIDKRVGHILL